MESKTRTAVLKGHKWRIMSAVFSPDGRLMLTTSADNTCRLWDVQTWTERTTFKGYMAGVVAGFFSADGKTVFTGCADDSIKLWNVATGQELLSLRIAPFDVSYLLVSPNGNTLALASSDPPTDLGAVHLIEAPSLTEIDAIERSRSAKK